MSIFFRMYCTSISSAKAAQLLVGMKTSTKESDLCGNVLHSFVDVDHLDLQIFLLKC
mgnify:CR=1 FL=1